MATLSTKFSHAKAKKSVVQLFDLQSKFPRARCVSWILEAENYIVVLGQKDMWSWNAHYYQEYLKTIVSVAWLIA